MISNLGSYNIVNLGEGVLNLQHKAAGHRAFSHNFAQHATVYKEFSNSPGRCGSVDWAPACEPKGGWFDSQ